MEVRWTVHIPQVMQQHGGGQRLRQDACQDACQDASAKNASVKTTPARETKAGDIASQSRPDET
jgi:hypothetical protein